MANQVRVHGLAETIARLKKLPADLAGKNGGPIRKAAFQAAKVIEEEAERLSPKDTGRLERNIIKIRDRNPRAAEGSPTELYRIGVRGGGKYGARVRKRERRKVFALGGSIKQANQAARGAEKDAYYWFFKEFGTSKMPATPFLRPAFEMKKEAAVKRFAEVLKPAVDALERSIK